MGKNLAETLLGAVVLAGAVIFLTFAYSKGGLKTVDGYSVVGKFDRVDGLAEGSDVRMSGIKIGTVISQKLDPKTYLAVLTMNVRKDVKLHGIVQLELRRTVCLVINICPLRRGLRTKCLNLAVRYPIPRGRLIYCRSSGV